MSVNTTATMATGTGEGINSMEQFSLPVHEHEWILYLSKGKYWKMFQVTIFVFSIFNNV